MIQIQGLSRQQVELADRMWSMEDMSEVNEFIELLPKRLRGQARVVRELMIAAAIDSEMDNCDLSLAKEVIDKLR